MRAKISYLEVDGQNMANVTYQKENELVASSRWFDNDDDAREFLARILKEI